MSINIFGGPAQTLARKQMDEHELEAFEDSSVSNWRDLLPHVTSEKYQ